MALGRRRRGSWRAGDVAGGGNDRVIPHERLSRHRSETGDNGQDHGAAKQYNAT
ncbi:MAG: hypothetical protein WKF82_08915 [Nocardioidaceae bacterium]